MKSEQSFVKLFNTKFVEYMVMEIGEDRGHILTLNMKWLRKC